MDPYYREEGKITLYLADACRALAELPSRSIDCIVTSPPYYGLRDYGTDGQIGLETTPGEYVARLASVFHEARRTLKDDGTLWLNLGDTYASRPATGMRVDDRPAKSLLGMPWRVAFALQDDGWLLRNEIIWHASNKMPTSASDRLAVKHETLFLFTKSPRYYFDLEAVRVKARTTGESHMSWNRKEDGFKVPGQSYTQHRGRDAVPGDGKANPGDVWDIPTVPFNGQHHATFPPELPDRCIRAGSPPDGVVCDPFNGSGTTGMMALYEGRRYIGIDISRDYLDLTLRTRLAQGTL
jgi:DNA modification methylase